MYTRAPLLASACGLFFLAGCGHNRIEAVAGGAVSPAEMATSPNTGLEVVGWMRRAHPSRALRSLSFTINTTEYRASSTVETRARAYVSLPGRIRVDLLPASRRAGYVRNRHRLAVFERGRRVSSASRVDLATLLTYDLFAQSIDTTIMWLDAARLRMALLRSDRLDGRRVWVVGAADGDETSPQFWVDANRWQVLRVIQRDPRVPSRITDVRYTEYTEVLGTPVPSRVEVYRNGELVQEQVITDFVANPALPSRVFDLTRWSAVRRGG